MHFRACHAAKVYPYGRRPPRWHILRSRHLCSNRTDIAHAMGGPGGQAPAVLSLLLIALLSAAHAARPQDNAGLHLGATDAASVIQAGGKDKAGKKPKHAFRQPQMGLFIQVRHSRRPCTAVLMCIPRSGKSGAEGHRCSPSRGPQSSVGVLSTALRRAAPFLRSAPPSSYRARASTSPSARWCHGTTYTCCWIPFPVRRPSPAQLLPHTRRRRLRPWAP